MSFSAKSWWFLFAQFAVPALARLPHLHLNRFESHDRRKGALNGHYRNVATQRQKDMNVIVRKTNIHFNDTTQSMTMDEIESA
jgi:hypothetical protein